MTEIHPFKRVARHPERWEKSSGELVALFETSVGTLGRILVPYTLPELKRIAQSMQPASLHDTNIPKEGLWPNEAQNALDLLEAHEGPCIAAE